MKGSLFVLLLLFAVQAYAQSPTSTLRGRVTDQATGTGLVSANVQLSPLNRATTTDENGYYRFDSLTVGYYQVTISYVGYSPREVAGISVNSGKEAIVDLALDAGVAITPIAVDAPQVEVSPFLPTAKILSVEASDRYPAAFNDPARLVTNFAGVAGENDQTNAISVRGLPTSAVSYRLQGIEIVNPNHLTGAGTRSDFGALSSGGVTMLSAQMLANSTFHNLQSPVGYNNNLGGVFDLSLRDGNRQKREHTVQAGLIGLDIATEGPIKKDKISYLANYRYSTVGLLSNLGIDFGDEDINYQDAALHLSGQLKRGKWSVFGMWGNNKNDFTGPEADSLRMEEKDRYESINAEGNLALLGYRFKHFLGKNYLLSMAGAYSVSQQDREQIESDLSLLVPRSYALDQHQSLFSNRLTLTRTVSAGQVDLGLQFNRWYDEREAYLGPPIYNFAYIKSQEQLQWMPFLTYRGLLGNHLRLRVGSSFALGKDPDKFSWLPVASVSYVGGSGLRLTATAERRSGRQPSYTRATLNVPNLFLSQLYNLASQYRTSSNIDLEASVFYQLIEDQPTLRDNPATFQYWMNDLSPIDQTASSYEILQLGVGRTYGLMAEAKKMDAGNFWTVNGSLFRSEFSRIKDDDAKDWQSTRYDLGYSVNLVYGRETHRKTSPDKTRFFGYSGSFALRGGFRERPIDVLTSAFGQSTVFVENSDFSERLPTYQRLDLRVYWKTEKRRSTHTLGVDIQNALNRGNIGFRQFDTIQGKVVDVEQLGIIPNISYRVHFR